jgi:twitching motility two-component system response regulator PilG
LRSLPQWNRTAIVVLSRRDGIIDRIKARLAGAQAYLTKPCTRQIIIEVVTTSLGRQAALSSRVGLVPTEKNMLPPSKGAP